MQGGRNIEFRWRMSPERLRAIISIVRMWWPKAIIKDSNSDSILVPPLVIPCFLQFHRDPSTFLRVSSGDLPEDVNQWVILTSIFDDSILFVVGPEGCEGDKIMRDIESAMKVSRRF